MGTLGRGFTVAAGTVRIIGKSPDGDSIRFVPNDVGTLRGLQGGDRVRPGPDGSVQLRLDAIDAPETHYKGRRQPFADVARDELVGFAGFRDVVYDGNGTVASAEPQERTAMIAAKLVETHGRPVCYLWTNLRAIDPPIMWGEGDVVEIGERQIATSVNAHMVRSGRVYTTLYTSTPPRLRAWFTDLALSSNTTGQNVWADDHSSAFTTVGGHDAIGENGVLLLPKLFRRVTDYIDARDAGTADDGVVAWLRTTTTPDGYPVDDQLDVDGRRIHLSDLIREHGPRIGLNADLHKLVFVEK